MITEDTKISINTPFLSVIARNPIFKLSPNDSLLSFFDSWIALFTTAVEVTVRKNVLMSITNRSLMSLTASSAPARTGEIRYLALPAMLIIPLALEYSSFVRRSVTVAR